MPSLIAPQGWTERAIFLLHRLPVVAGRWRVRIVTYPLDEISSYDELLAFVRAPMRDRLVGRWSLRVIRRIRPDIEIREVEGPHLLLQRQPTASCGR
jgi:hypothetical protein